ncbi:glycosyltransferase family 4 protein [Flavisolibacter nicotianae]|uniref:glycosyltransferase family 4 protein n=1 Tax=Flavisolibacter nicotianae TaxID=2364882 RepID=UPI0019692CF3|nr:glycosyltransferase family 4 protein [Flavisolibacter nicotianae]
MTQKAKLIRITTVPISLKVLLRQQLRFMADHYDVLAVSSPGKTLEDVRASEGVRVAGVPMSRAITPLKDAKALWQLYWLFKKEHPTIVHTHTPKAGLLGMLAGRLAGVPVRLHTVAGMPLMESRGLKKKLLSVVEWLTYRCATKVYPNSTNLAKYIEDHKFCQAGKLKVLGNGSSNGIDMEFFQLTDGLEASVTQTRKALGIDEKDFVYLFIGRLVRDKGIEELVDAFCRLRSTANAIKLLLVGPYEPERDPLPITVQKAIEDDKDIIRIDFQQDVRPFLAISDVLVFPSYREGFPNVPMQAGCFHLPSIVTDINGCNEIIQHGKNGLIVPVKNVDALRKAMGTLRNDRELFLRMKANARQWIGERYEQKQFWNILLNEYRDQLTAHGIVSEIS